MSALAVASKLPRMIIYVEPDLKEAAEKLAKRQRRSVSSLVCVLLEQAIAHAKAQGELKESPSTSEDTDNE